MGTVYNEYKAACIDYWLVANNNVDHPSCPICIAQTQLNCNAASIPSHSGDGIHSHLALTITPGDDLLLTGMITFIPPANPLAQLEHPAQATASQILEINCLHTSAQATFCMYLKD